MNKQEPNDTITKICTIKFNSSKIAITDPCYADYIINNIQKKYVHYKVLKNLMKGNYNVYKYGHDFVFYDLIHVDMDNNNNINKKYDFKETCTIDSGTIGMYCYADMLNEFEEYGLPNNDDGYLIEGENITFLSPAGDIPSTIRFWEANKKVYRIRFKLLDF